jgi:hypothetical protein
VVSEKPLRTDALRHRKVGELLSFFQVSASASA